MKRRSSLGSRRPAHIDAVNGKTKLKCIQHIFLNSPTGWIQSSHRTRCVETIFFLRLAVEYNIFYASTPLKPSIRASLDRELAGLLTSTQISECYNTGHGVNEVQVCQVEAELLKRHVWIQFTLCVVSLTSHHQAISFTRISPTCSHLYSALKVNVTIQSTGRMKGKPAT